MCYTCVMINLFQNLSYYLENHPIITLLVILGIAAELDLFSFLGMRMYLPITPGRRRVLRLKKELEQKFGFKKARLEKESLLSLLKFERSSPADFILREFYKGTPVTIKIFNNKMTGNLKGMFTSNVKDFFTGISVVIFNDKDQFKISKKNLSLEDIETLLNQLASLRA